MFISTVNMDVHVGTCNFNEEHDLISLNSGDFNIILSPEEAQTVWEGLTEQLAYRRALRRMKQEKMLVAEEVA